LDSYVGDISEHQQEVLNQFKEWIKQNDITHNPWHNDVHFLKFCRARKFDLEKIIEMFSNYMAYRNEFNLDTIVTDFHFEQKLEVLPYYPRGYCGVCKKGRPIYIERSGQISPSKIQEIVDYDTLFKSYY